MTSLLQMPLIAQSINNKALPSDLGSLNGVEFFGNLIPALLSFGIVLGVIIFTAYLIYGAISWISSGGDKMKIEQARNKISTALVGIVILLSFFAILTIVEYFFGIGLRKVEIGPFNISFSDNSGTSGGIDCSVTPPINCDPDCPICDPDSGWSCDDSGMYPYCPI